MISYIARRLMLAAFTVAMISMLAFLIVELPEGDAATKRFDHTASSLGEVHALEIRRGAAPSTSGWTGQSTCATDCGSGD